MTPKTILAVVLVVAVLLAWTRLILWARAAETPSRPWRLTALLALQPACAVLLFLGLFPPSTPVAGDVLTVLTANAPRDPLAARRSRVVAMPEADAPGVERAPDLGAALRRYPDVRRIKVLGAGLTARDRDAARGLAVDFQPTPPKPGLVSLRPPARVAPGMRFEAGGQVVGGDVIELLDPAGRLTDSQKVDAQGRFVVSGATRAAGLVAFTLRVRDGKGRIVEQADLPVRVVAEAAPRLLILAGAPGPEVKYLRRWATDAGFAVTTQMTAGGGVQLGDAPIAISAATLRQFDVAIVDDRGWSGLGAGRETVLGAVREGLGLVLRAGGQLDDAGRAQWRALGFSVGDVSAPLVLPPAPDATVARTRLGVGSLDAPIEPEDDHPPELSRLALTAGQDAVPLIQDASGATLSAWRTLGLGRVAVFGGLDSYGLVLTGRGVLHGDWWSQMLSTVARPVSGATIGRPALAWTGERLALCGLPDGAEIEGSDGATAVLHADPAAGGCAGFWPRRVGWHVLRKAGSGAVLDTVFVHAGDQLAGVRAARDRDATAMLRGGGAGDAAATSTQPGPAWPWLLAWLVLGALLWWLERSSLGRVAKALSPT